MKTLKFTPELSAQILAGTKTSTWRLFDDKDLTVGDAITFINKETLETIGTGEITNLYIKTLGTLEEKDWMGHERYTSEQKMYAAYRGYYGDIVNPDSIVKILQFSFKPIT
ncbi:MAG: ASCH domain-containing protein [Patescibacteria group bacterium]